MPNHMQFVQNIVRNNPQHRELLLTEHWAGPF